MLSKMCFVTGYNNKQHTQCIPTEWGLGLITGSATQKSCIGLGSKANTTQQKLTNAISNSRRNDYDIICRNNKNASLGRKSTGSPRGCGAGDGGPAGPFGWSNRCEQAILVPIQLVLSYGSRGRPGLGLGQKSIDDPSTGCGVGKSDLIVIGAIWVVLRRLAEPFWWSNKGNGAGGPCSG
ncbi:hypothetical protein FXO38_05757 [Capsicum annuum]|nr:hypothetical protein FXO38_05757 [Capsicum annuum]